MEQQNGKLEQRLCILYIAMSLDGYIAGPNDSIDFLSVVEQEGEDYGYAEFQKEVDVLIWGRRTYDKFLSFGVDFPHRDKKCYVVSSPAPGAMKTSGMCPTWCSWYNNSNRNRVNISIAMAVAEWWPPS
ncbi:MAG TPA: hypothetical protein VIK80_07240 [Flavihumibacter sp.]